MTVVPLDEAHDESTYGGKAVSLGAALRAGLPVPSGFVLAAPFVDRIAEQEPEAVATLAAQHIAARRLAVRSSAVGEDSADASFAGQHATKLNVGRDEVAAAVRVVWESARSPAALSYRARKGLALDPRIAAVVQTLVEPLAAGVLFTRNPMTGADERVIEATWGLGEAVVSGAVTPDRYLLSGDGRLIDVTPGLKDLKIWFGEGDGTIEVALHPDLHQAPCLQTPHLDALHELAERCQRVWGPHLDIEWAVDEANTVYLLQCRPITAGRTGPA